MERLGFLFIRYFFMLFELCTCAHVIHSHFFLNFRNINHFIFIEGQFITVILYKLQMYNIAMHHF